MAGAENRVRLDLNNPIFQKNLFELDKPEQAAALKTLAKISKLAWDQLYRDAGLKWEKVSSVQPPAGVDAIYSLRITRSRRAVAWRENDFLRLLVSRLVTMPLMAGSSVVTILPAVREPPSYGSGQAYGAVG
jgi:hypothetical protein